MNAIQQHISSKIRKAMARRGIIDPSAVRFDASEAFDPTPEAMMAAMDNDLGATRIDVSPYMTT